MINKPFYTVRELLELHKAESVRELGRILGVSESTLRCAEKVGTLIDLEAKHKISKFGR